MKLYSISNGLIYVYEQERLERRAQELARTPPRTREWLEEKMASAERIRQQILEERVRYGCVILIYFVGVLSIC